MFYKRMRDGCLNHTIGYKRINQHMGEEVCGTYSLERVAKVKSTREQSQARIEHLLASMKHLGL